MMPEWTPIKRWAVAALLGVVCCASAASGQGTGDAQPSGEIDISADLFGVGGSARVGEWVGLRLELKDSAERPREVLVRVEVKDGDGDTILYQDSVATNPGFDQPAWVYFRLPFWFNSSTVLKVTANAAEELGAAPRDPALPRFTAGRLLGLARVSAPTNLLYSHVGMYGHIGRSLMGLERYEGDRSGDGHPSGQERTEIVQIDAGKLPDRWMGLAQFDMIAWGAGQPGALTPEVAHAVREWVRRGGHLVIVIPRVGETWSDPATNPLHDIMPSVRLERREEADLNPLEPIIRWPRTGDARPLPSKETLHVFSPMAEGEWGEGVFPILNARDGGCIVVRRLHGAGAVTLVGLDLNAGFFTSARLPRPELFWHRILGRRGMMLTAPEFTPSLSERPTIFAPTGRDTVTLDRDFGGQIDKKEQAAAGVLVGFVVFVAYWLVAGPVGFFLLKRSGHAQHAWVAFLAAAGLFTAIAWGGAAAIRPSRVRGFHLTFLDHVYGQDWQRARSWVNVLTPVYGEAGVSIGDPEQRSDAPALADRVHNAVSPWEPPGSGAGGGFPDARGYPIECRWPENVRFPARSTVKQFQVDWSGGPRWEMPTPQAGPDGKPVLDLLPPGDGQSVLRGVLKHALPGPLRDVCVIVVRGQKDLTSSPFDSKNHQEQILSRVVTFVRPSPWPANEPWDLSTLTQAGPEQKIDRDSVDFFEKLLTARRPDDQLGGSAGDEGLAGRLMALSLYSQLPPPDLTEGNLRTAQNLALRRLTHGWDLGRWFTQPCVIVIGNLGPDEPSPVPLYVDVGGGYRAAPTGGRTVVRWVYPLPGSPPSYPPATKQSDESGEGGAG